MTVIHAKGAERKQLCSDCARIVSVRSSTAGAADAAPSESGRSAAASS
jgi:hypothetical protein